MGSISEGRRTLKLWTAGILLLTAKYIRQLSPKWEELPMKGFPGIVIQTPIFALNSVSLPPQATSWSFAEDRRIDSF